MYGDEWFETARELPHGGDNTYAPPRWVRNISPMCCRAVPRRLAKRDGTATHANRTLSILGALASPRYVGIETIII